MTKLTTKRPNPRATAADADANQGPHADWNKLTAGEKSVYIEAELRAVDDEIAARARLSESELIAWHALRSLQSEHYFNPGENERKVNQ